MTNVESLQKILNARGEFNKFDKSQNSKTLTQGTKNIPNRINMKPTT